MSIAEVKKIRTVADLEAEVFLFGYLCYSQDSICYMGDYFASEPCNVFCAQNIRFMEQGRPLPPQRHFFMKYMNGLSYIPELVEAGVDSVKIEGRQRSANYVYRTTKVFREAIDHYKACKKHNLKYQVKKAWSRQLAIAAYGFELTEGFYIKNKYKRKVLKKVKLSSKLIYLYDILSSFIETFNFTKLRKEVRSSWQIDRLVPKLKHKKSAEKIKAFK